jgi:hypothetical protein
MMMNMNVAVFCMILGVTLAGAAEPQPTLAKPLEPLRPFLGKTWKGPFKSSTPDKPKYDVARWERALNGQAVRVLHSVGDGAYGGETLITWNNKTKELQFHYFTTAGFTTHGTMTFEGSKVLTTEKVTGNQNGISEVKATTELLPDGRMHTKSRYFKQGQWVDGHEVTYTETPGAEVVFR